MTEAEEQKIFIAWFKAEYPKYEKCIRLSMNGVNLGYGSKAARMIASMKKQGLTPGESDLAFMIPTEKHHGLLIEMKSMTGKPTEAQIDYIDLMNDLGYFACVCRGAEEAKTVMREYLLTTKSS